MTLNEMNFTQMRKSHDATNVSASEIKQAERHEMTRLSTADGGARTL